ncbi:ketopantoate reductase family protein [Curtobacterium sp. VKM Ac-2887]|uniref:ketopantoate reductase family protein n=1 Tax=Curtobacterium sp. VKM Ac-2887 TaxID=2783819 RepID=UPI00188A3B2E|nr:2-dehydropantoate 2-reductase N-terminal domain-containing protein [Curtobacterium sp. VKM Ac-2887]MBF4588224.1 ketopantoate reductase [Curtobacterium sp. VKM Ac-2887]
MRVLMFGRGVIATVYGQAFANAGYDVVFAVRPSRIAEYGDEVQIDLVDGRRSALGRRSFSTFNTELRDVSDPGQGFDLIVVSVGHHRLREAVASVAPHVGDATVLIFGNVWDEPFSAVAPLPADQVRFGFPGAGGGFGSDGVLHGAVFRSVVLGATGTSADRRDRVVRTVFTQAGFVVKEQRDMRGWLWLHFAMDVGMFSQALRSGGLANMIGDRAALHEAFRTSRELLPVLRARGVDLRRHRGVTLPARLPRLAATASAVATALVPIARVSLAAHADPNAAEPTAVIADALATARQLDFPTPRLNRAVQADR